VAISRPALRSRSRHAPLCVGQHGEGWAAAVARFGHNREMAPRDSDMPDDVRTWVEEHGDVLQAVWDRYEMDGEWPDAARLTRERFAVMPRRDFAAVAQRMPPILGRLELVTGTAAGSDSQVIALTPRGLLFVPNARPLLDDFARLIRAAVGRYANPDGEATVRTAEFGDLLGVSEARVHQLDDMAALDGWLLRPSGGSRGDMCFAVDEHAVLHVAAVETVDEYLRAQARAWWPAATSPVATPRTGGPDAEALLRDGVVSGGSTASLELDELHPIVRDACTFLFEDGHPREAVQAAVMAVLDELRDLSGLSDCDGEELVGRALLRKDPLVVVADLATQTGRSVQRGTALLAQGAIAAIRNPGSHRRLELTQSEAIEQLAVLSFIARRLEDARSASAKGRPVAPGAIPEDERPGSEPM
jgi:uncharacterized protein (TIGR02391 family)